MKGFSPAYNSMKISVAFICIFILGALPFTPSYARANEVPPEVELGRKVFAQIRPYLKFTQNPAIQETVERIGSKVIEDLPHHHYEFQFFPIVASDVNAFALPNGYIFVTNRLIEACDSEDELAFVLSHETAHVMRGHFMKFLSQKKKADLATLAIIVLGAIIARDADLQGGLPAIGMGINQSLSLSYSREQEYDADSYGLKYLNHAGYDMEKATKFMEKLRLLSQISISIPVYLSTHPMPIDRVINMERLKASYPSGAAQPCMCNFKRLKLWCLLETEPSVKILADLDADYKHDQDDIDIMYGLALVKEGMGDSEEAEGLYRKCISLRPEDTDVLRDYGIFLYRRGRMDEAESRLKRTTELDSGDPLAFHYLARVLMDKNDTKKAIDAFTQSKRLSPEFPENYHFLGILYSQEGNKEESHKNFERYFLITGNREAAEIHARKRATGEEEGKSN